MNERLKELAEQAGLMPMWVCVNESTGGQVIKPIDEQAIERFAELVLNDEPQNCPKWDGMKPIDGELRIKAGIKLSHKDPYCMEGVDMARGKMYSPLEALQNYADLVRQDERVDREWCGNAENPVKCIGHNDLCRGFTCKHFAEFLHEKNRTLSIEINRLKTSKDLCGND